MAHLDDPIMALEDRHGDLTFGLEIEFLTPVLEGSDKGECISYASFWKFHYIVLHFEVPSPSVWWRAWPQLLSFDLTQSFLACIWECLEVCWDAFIPGIQIANYYNSLERDNRFLMAVYPDLRVPHVSLLAGSLCRIIHI